MEHASITSIISVVAWNAALPRATWDQLMPTPLGPSTLAARLCVGCVYDTQPRDTFGLLVTRAAPRPRRAEGHRLRPVATVHAHWPLFAPSVRLLTGHETTCQSRRCQGAGRCMGHTPLHLGWPAFAAAYRAELEQQLFRTRLAVARQIAAWLRAVP